MFRKAVSAIQSGVSQSVTAAQQANVADAQDSAFSEVGYATVSVLFVKVSWARLICGRWAFS